MANKPLGSRIMSNPLFTPEEEERFSIIDSIAHLYKKKPTFSFIGWFRKTKHPFQIHKDNCNTVMKMAEKIGSHGLMDFAIESEDLLNLKINPDEDD